MMRLGNADIAALYYGSTKVSKAYIGALEVTTGDINFIQTLFASGEQGAWYDPSDLSTLFQDAAGTVPVAVDGDPVGRVSDLSGNGNHATQEVSARRPVYRTDGTLHWLDFDGVDDHIKTADIPVPAGFASIAAQLNMTGSPLAGATTLLGASIDDASVSGFRLYFYTNGSDGIWRDFAGGIAPRGATFRVNGVSTRTIIIGAPSVNTADATGATSLPELTRGAQIGKDRDLNRGYVKGKFFGGVLHESILAPSDRVLVEQYLAKKSGAIFL